MTALETRFEQALPNLNTSRSNLIRDILENAEDTYFLSSRALAKRYNIDKATIVRSVQDLGYREVCRVRGRFGRTRQPPHALQAHESSGARASQRLRSRGAQL